MFWLRLIEANHNVTRHLEEINYQTGVVTLKRNPMLEPHYLFTTNIDGRLTDPSLENMRAAKDECEREILHAIELFHERTGLSIEEVIAYSTKFGVANCGIGGPSSERIGCAKVIIESV